MALSLAYVGVYAVLVGIASFLEVPVGRPFGPFQLNALIRIGSLAAASAAVLAVDGLAIPSGAGAFAGLGIGVIAGVGSICYCFALRYLPISMVVTLSNLYLVITTLLGILVLREPITALKFAGLACMLVGVLALAQPPARFGVHRESNLEGKVPPARGLVLMGTYVVIVGVGAFLEKPALRSLDATHLNAFMSIAMTAVAGIAFAVSGPRLPLTRGTLAGVGVGAMMGVASVFYFLGLRGLPVSAAAALSNSSVIVTVALSTVVLRRPLTRGRVGSLALTLLGAVLLALSSG